MSTVVSQIVAYLTLFQRLKLPDRTPYSLNNVSEWSRDSTQSKWYILDTLVLIVCILRTACSRATGTNVGAFTAASCMFVVLATEIMRRDMHDTAAGWTAEARVVVRPHYRGDLARRSIRAHSSTLIEQIPHCNWRITANIASRAEDNKQQDSTLVPPITRSVGPWENHACNAEKPRNRVLPWRAPRH